MNAKISSYIISTYFDKFIFTRMTNNCLLKGVAGNQQMSGSKE